MSDRNQNLLNCKKVCSVIHSSTCLPYRPTDFNICTSNYVLQKNDVSYSQNLSWMGTCVPDGPFRRTLLIPEGWESFAFLFFKIFYEIMIYLIAAFHNALWRYFLIQNYIVVCKAWSKAPLPHTRGYATSVAKPHMLL